LRLNLFRRHGDIQVADRQFGDFDYFRSGTANGHFPTPSRVPWLSVAIIALRIFHFDDSGAPVTVTKPTPATATVVHETARIDVALPAGTTIASLMATLRIDSTNPDLAIALPDGSPAPLHAVIGTDVPSGSLLTVASGELIRRSRIEQAEADDEAWLSTAIATGATVTFSVIIGAGLIVAPLLVPTLQLGWAVRIAAALAIILALGTLAWGGHAKSVGIGPLVAPGLIGVAAMAPFDPQWPSAPPLALATGSVVAALASFASWQFGRRTSTATVTLWGLLAVIALALAAFQAGPAQVGAALVATGVGAILLAPSLATSVPPSQLLDLPLLSTSASDIRVPTAPKPLRVTPRRVHSTVLEAGTTTDTVTIAGAAIAAIGGATLATQATIANTSGLAAVICLVSATIGLALAPRGSRSTISQVAPRISAATIFAATVAGLAREPWPLIIGVTAIIAAAFGVVIGAASSKRDQPSAFWGRTGDILQAISLGLLFPAAFVAADAFELIWQATS
jgi:hypothetical protein